MGRAKKQKTRSPRKPMDPEAKRRLRRGALYLSLVTALAAGATVGVSRVQRWVETRAALPTEPPMVVMKDRPGWMSDSLVEQILSCARPAGVRSAFDHQLLEDIAGKLARNPWVRTVRQVRRVYSRQPGDTVEIDCEYRAPQALVRTDRGFLLVDGEGFVLPERYTAEQVPQIVLGPDRQMNLRIIDGVKHEPPKPGQKWPGDDLLAGLDLAKLLHGRQYTDDIFKIDVSNFQGRRSRKDAQIVLVTRWGTEVRWGRPINAKDFFVEVSIDRKLESLAEVYAEFGRVDARRPWIDIRYDRITYPAPEPADAHAAIPLNENVSSTR